MIFFADTDSRYKMKENITFDYVLNRCMKRICSRPIVVPLLSKDYTATYAENVFTSVGKYSSFLLVFLRGTSRQEELLRLQCCDK